MFRKPVFWVGLTVISAACAFFSFEMFPSAFPIVNLELKMDRETALARSRDLADEHGWGPEGYRQAASFSLDSSVQAFVELEGGGTAAFAAMMEDGWYEAYRWSVRHFKEGEANETVIRFDPAGRPYGFREKLPEDEPGAALEAEAAREIAESAVTSPWGVDLAEFELVESSEEVQFGGRVDHTFVYERPDRFIGEGRFRLRLGVGGDRFTELTHFVKVPESFTRRYEEMRSANNGIGQGGALAMLLLYGIGGIGVGLFVLLRKRAVVWKQALGWGAFVSLLQVLMTLNHWPLAWMGYDTALSAGNFALQQIAQMVIQFFGTAVLLALAFMAAEGLTRLAFPKQIQLWKLWSKDAARSRSVVGMTVGGYLAVALFMAYDVSLYFFAHGWLGWWTPSSAQIDPDILATWFPWFDSIAISLQAGFMEECLFRAVPIAGAALIGQRFGGRRYWIVGAFVVQALIFGSGHAPYPTQPSYARVVELILPSIGFGLIYLRFGLLPGIVLHYAIDVVWISLPLFASTAPGVGMEQGLVVLFALVPLAIVVAARVRGGSWTEVAPRFLNGAWIPAAARPIPERASAPARAAGLGATTRVTVIVLGVAGLVVWGVGGSFTSDAPEIEIGRSEALVAARVALGEQGFVPEDDWREMSTVIGDPRDPDRFVWTEGGPEEYRQLLGEYLWPPRWWVRYARFEGDVAERAEEYQAVVDGAGQVFRTMHTLAEATPGADLEEQEARSIARDVVNARYPGADLEEVVARPSKLPDRTDWRFEFRNAAEYPLDTGEARVVVGISGDEVTDTYRYVDVPEEWEREERNRETAVRVLRGASAVGLAAIFGSGLVGAIVAWSRRRFSVRAFVIATVAMSVLGVIAFVNRWPVAESNFSTAQPFVLQAGLALGFGLVGAGLLGAVVGFNVGLAQRWLPARAGALGPGDAAVGLALGFAAAGLVAVADMLGPQRDPLWAGYDPVASFVPFLSASLQPVSSFILRTALALLTLSAVDRFTSGWTRRRPISSVALLAVGLVMAGTGADDLAGWLVAGVGTGIVLWASYVFVLRNDPALIPLASAGIGIPVILHDGLMGGYPGALTGAAVATILVGSAAVLWSRRLVEISAARE